MSKKTIVFDFDGVIHKYSKGWQGLTNIYDEPVEGIKEVIQQLIKEYEVIVVSTRCAEIEGLRAVREWLQKYNIQTTAIKKEKPPAMCYVDDRAINFNGNINGLYERISTFENWINKKNKYQNMNKETLLSNLLIKEKQFEAICEKAQELEMEDLLEIYDKWINTVKEYVND